MIAERQPRIEDLSLPRSLPLRKSVSAASAPSLPRIDSRDFTEYHPLESKTYEVPLLRNSFAMMDLGAKYRWRAEANEKEHERKPAGWQISSTLDWPLPTPCPRDTQPHSHSHFTLSTDSRRPFAKMHEETVDQLNQHKISSLREVSGRDTLPVSQYYFSISQKTSQLQNAPQPPSLAVDALSTFSARGEITASSSADERFSAARRAT